MKISPIFIVGCPRSGTTLLRDLLRSHPHLTFPEESHFIPSLYRGYGDPRDESEARELAEAILRIPWVRAWGLSLDPSSFAGDRSYARIVARVYEAWALKENKPRWGDKTPVYVLHIPLLLEIFPAAKILHIYRDGRDVALSLLRVRFGPRNVFTAAESWKRMVSAGRRAGATLPRESYREVRYETLLGAPRETMREVCTFIDEPFTDAVLQPSPLAGWHRYAPLLGRARPRKPRPAEIIAGNAEKWKTTMSPSQRTIFESVAGDLLQTLGYETAGPRRRIAAPERWMWRAHHSVLWLARRQNQKGYYKELAEGLLRKWKILRQRRHVEANK